MKLVTLFNCTIFVTSLRSLQPTSLLAAILLKDINPFICWLLVGFVLVLELLVVLKLRQTYRELEQ